MSDTKESPKTLFLIRHGQSSDNILPIFQTQTSELTSAGIEQAGAIAGYFAQSLPKVERIISSTLPRAKQTAAILSDALNLSFETTDLLVERVGPVSIAGQPYSDKVADALWREWEHSFYTTGDSVDKSETYTALFNRAQVFLSQVAEREETTIAAITHGYFLRVLIATVLLGKTPDAKLFNAMQNNLKTSNGGVTILRYQKNFESGYAWRLETYNQTRQTEG